MDITKLLKKEFPDCKHKRIGKGCVNLSYSITCDNKDYIFRYFPKEGWKAKKEKYVYDLIKRKTTIPVPTVDKIGKNYIILSKVPGTNFKTSNTQAIEQAGETLGKLHNIQFDKFGWIVGNEIKPSFNLWNDFIEYDLNHKMRKAKKLLPKSLLGDISAYFKENKELLHIKTKPCLLHKDYHLSHIFWQNKKISGIIDVEWAVAGHNEMDLAKSSLWMFSKDKAAEKIFLKGYKKHHTLSKEHEKRKDIYHMLILFSSLIFSCELKSKKWYKHNLNNLRGIVDEHN